MDAENPINSKTASDLNSTNMLLLELEIIFFCQWLKEEYDCGPDFGPKCGPFKVAINLEFLPSITS